MLSACNGRRAQLLLHSFWTAVLGLALTGCQKPEWLPEWAYRPLVSRSPASCDPFAASSCATGDVCVRTGKTTTACVRAHVGSTPLIPFPFPPAQAVRCLRGPREAAYADESSHSTADALYALDLASLPSSPPGKIYAGLDGVALVHSGCEQGQGKDPTCGGGLGNHVRIFNKDGLLVLYAHLESVAVEDGQTIHAGTLIGVEGSSGRAETRHLHFSVHHVTADQPAEWIENLSRFRSKPGSVPLSISFETLFCDPTRTDACHRKRARAEQIPCGPGAAQAPLRADWRN